MHRCMEEMDITDDQFKKIIESEEAGDANSCLFGCALNEKYVVSYFLLAN